jgi:hypothetical protein
MRSVRLHLAIAAFFGCGPLAAQPLAVDFVRPDRFTDASFRHGPGSDQELDDILQEIEQHLRALAARHLSATQSLSIEVRDVDLAGRIEPPGGAPSGVRVLRAFTPPSITVHYRFDDAGRTAERDERIVDMNYQSRSPLYASSDRLRYEKAMLDDWFEARFVKRQPPH